MTIREYNLARQGHERQLEDRRRREAEWMAMILNSQYSEAGITPGHLLGEEKVGEKKATKAELTKAEKKLDKLLALYAGKGGK
jgi:hypothetical protein